MPRSREAILASVRRMGGVERPLPELPHFDVPEADPAVRFAEQLAAAGGRSHSAEGAGAVAATIGALPGVADAARLFSGVAAVASRHPTGAPVVPGDLSGVDVAVLPGAPAVAESGAVWVVPPDLLSRAALFLAERVVLVVPASSLVHTLHEAYAALDARPPRFGCFVSGPSKTADIEQALVIGAHGPRALDVVLYADW